MSTKLIPPDRWLYCDADQFLRWLAAGRLKPIEPLANTSNKGHLRWRHPRQRVVAYLEKREEPATLANMAHSFRISKIAVRRTVSDLLEAGVLVETQEARGNVPQRVALSEKYLSAWQEYDAAKLASRGVHPNQVKFGKVAL